MQLKTHGARQDFTCKVHACSRCPQGSMHIVYTSMSKWERETRRSKRADLVIPVFKHLPQRLRGTEADKKQMEVATLQLNQAAQAHKSCEQATRSIGAHIDNDANIDNGRLVWVFSLRDVEHLLRCHLIIAFGTKVKWTINVHNT